jgi:NAD(P)-dependent dehydrogenase (short-subunit alcohol dehydrogenase family)
MDINFSRLVDLSVKFLPHLLAKKPAPTALVFTGSLLAAVPAVMVPAYSASKAALTAYASCLRRQHRGSNVKIIEVWPPLVQSKQSPLPPLPPFYSSFPPPFPPPVSLLPPPHPPVTSANTRQASYTTTWAKRKAAGWGYRWTCLQSRRGHS